MLKKYEKKNLVFFSVDIGQKENKEGFWKKNIKFPKEWQNFTIDNNIFKKSDNGLAFLTGKINDIIVIDIDNVDHWKKILQKNKEEEPNTVKAISGSGGIHLYFKYDENLENITSKTQCFGKEYDIDIRTNGGCIICPPTKYYNENMKKNVEYVLVKSIIDHDPIPMPNWIKELLYENNKKEKKYMETKNKNKEEIEITNDIKKIDIQKIEEEDTEIPFSEEDLEFLIDILALDRCDNYNDWISIGMILYNISKEYKYIWKKWSKKSLKYEHGICDEKWKSFKKDKNGLNIGTLLLWCQNDNKEKYLDFIKQKRMGNLILQKFPNEKLILGKTIVVNEKCNYTHIHNQKCLIKGDKHEDMKSSMYVEIIDKFMTIKCKHTECFGKTYPCNHILMNKNEMNIAFNGNFNITINNGENNETIEFPKINLYNDEKLNDLIYNGLNGKASMLAKIVFYFYENDFIYGEDNEWYMFESHRWKIIGNKNPKLRLAVENKLLEIYNQLYKCYKDEGYDKKKLNEIKKIIDNLGDTANKNNIITELIDLFSEIKNPKRDFTKKLDTNNYLIGFENGVYDLQKFEFRDGKFDDFISYSVGYDYKNEYSENKDNLMKFLEDILPDIDDRNYLLTYLSIGLIGNELELFTILTGEGRNGKSKIVELLHTTLGDYAGCVSAQLFTRPRPNANSPDPGLLDLAKKKVVISSEPEKNEKLNSGFIKFITGRDMTSLRMCHKNEMISFVAKFITLFICNDIPECDDIDNAFCKRLRCVGFPTEFVHKPIHKHQRKIDVNINKNFEIWKSDFMLILIDYYKKYTETKELKVTDNILKWTNKYKENTDSYLQFLTECMEEIDDKHILLVDMYDNFKFWFKTNFPNILVPSKREFGKNIRKYKTIEESVRVGNKVQAGIKNYDLKDSFVFMENEAKIHIDAKNKCRELFSGKYQTCTEYPLYYHNNTNTIDAILDFKKIKNCKEYFKDNKYPIALIDVMCAKNDKIVFGIEVKNTHEVNYSKKIKVKEMIEKSSNKINIYEIDAKYILENNILDLDNKFKKII
jgi:P4 family phage/plasmid primase-like protien